MLVILAILAAIMIPALTGWIDKAREKQVMLDARNVEMAAQAGLYQQYATDDTFSKATGSKVEDGNLGKYVTDICGEKWADNVTTCTVDWDEKANITKFVYTAKGQTATFDGATWKIEPVESKTPESSSEPSSASIS